MNPPGRTKEQQRQIDLLDDTANYMNSIDYAKDLAKVGLTAGSFIPVPAVNIPSKIGLTTLGVSDVVEDLIKKRL